MIKNKIKNKKSIADRTTQISNMKMRTNMSTSEKEREKMSQKCSNWNSSNGLPGLESPKYFENKLDPDAFSYRGQKKCLVISMSSFSKLVSSLPSLRLR